MPHDKSIPCLNQERENGTVYCSAHREKELEAEYQAVAGKKEKGKSLGHKSNFHCLVLAYKLKIQ